MKNNKQNLSQEWFHIGEEELKFAQAGFKELEAFYPQICFQCQQAVEKYLKGFLVYHQKTFPKIHDLVNLLKLCARIDKDLLQFLESANTISQYYLVTRYPLEYPPASKKEAQEALGLAQEIINFIKTKVRNL